jgi:aryl-alcohol dehydrogenase-like predicted oxidoreductase
MPALVVKAIEAGVNSFDTADVYALGDSSVSSAKPFEARARRVRAT